MCIDYLLNNTSRDILIYDLIYDIIKTHMIINNNYFFVHSLYLLQESNMSI
jgi:hypothetical protein